MTAGPCEWLAESESLSIQAGDWGGGERITSVRRGERGCRSRSFDLYVQYGSVSPGPG
jgi:hypothetical protein